MEGPSMEGCAGNTSVGLFSDCGFLVAVAFLQEFIFLADHSFPFLGLCRLLAYSCLLHHGCSSFRLIPTEFVIPGLGRMVSHS